MFVKSIPVFCAFALMASAACSTPVSGALPVKPATFLPVSEIVQTPSETPIRAQTVKVIVNFKPNTALDAILKTYLKDKTAASAQWEEYWLKDGAKKGQTEAPKLVRFSRGSNLIIEAQTPAQSEQIEAILSQNADVKHVSIEKTAYRQY